MKRLLFTSIFMLVCVYFAHADMLVLKNGNSLECTLLFENELVIVVKDVKGTRYQYPKADVAEFRSTDTEVVIQDTPVDEPSVKVRNTNLGVEFRGGGVTSGMKNWGGAFGLDVLVGSHKIGGREILLGGMVGYELRVVGGVQAHFLPIQLAVRVPILESKHAPYAGVNIGYGVGLKNARGGLHAGATLGYRYRISDFSSLLIGADITWQQTTISQLETLGDKIYTSQAHNLVSLGGKIGFTF